MTAWCRERLGAELTAFCLGLSSTRQVSRYASGATAPPPARLARLLSLRQASVIVADAFGDSAARAFLTGRNSTLGDCSPAQVMRSGDRPDRAVGAARAFVEGAY